MKRSTKKFIIGLVLVIITASIYIFFWEKLQINLRPNKLVVGKYFNRQKDLHDICIALENYKKIFGYYPKSVGFDGYFSSFGRSGEDWIIGLTPTFIQKLPRDPRLEENPLHQYLYNSNGLDYKLISHQPDDYDQAIWSFRVFRG